MTTKAHLILFVLILSACSSNPKTPIETTQAARSKPGTNFCKLHVVGNRIQDAQGNVFVLHGANVPTVTEMATSPQKAAQRLQEMADDGAKIVRLPVDENELIPSFIPEKLTPVIEQANKLGMVVVVRYRNNPKKTLNTQADEAEDFLRQMLSYPIGSVPGVWFEPFDRPIPDPEHQDRIHARNRGVTQAMVDVVRGLKSDAIMLISNLEEASKDPAKLLSSTNLVYGIYDVEHISHYPTSKAPFMYPSWLSRSVAEDDYKIGVIAQTYEKGSTGLSGEVLRKYWQAQNAKYGNNLLGC